jgi:flagellar motility protein MotE (MotC chaperone)
MTVDIVDGPANARKTVVQAAYLLIVVAIAALTAFPAAAKEIAAHFGVASANYSSGKINRSGLGTGRIVVAEAGAHGDEGHDGKKAKEPELEPPVPHGAEAAKLTAAEQYCAAVGDVAAKTLFANQRQALEQAQAGLEARIKSLNEKTEKLQAWIKKREDFLKSASDSLVEIYTKMKPEVAAAQLVVMNQTMAAAIVARLPPKAASAVLAEMDATRAARMSAVLAGAAEVQDVKPAAEKKDKP